MFRKRIKKNDYVENRVKPPKKRNLRFSVKFNKRFSKKLELHSLTRLKNDFPQIRDAYIMFSKKEPYIITASSSIVGNRKTQEDSFFVTPSDRVSPFKLSRSFAVVCDGMGGLEAGDRASMTAVSMMKLAVSKLPTKKVDIPHFFSEMLDYIDCEINGWKDLETDKGSGTTLVSVLIENRRLYWASVGDSSIFMFQDDTLKKLTNEHNYRMYLEKLVSNGKITQREADEDPQQYALLSYVGMGGIAFRDINSRPYAMRDGDMLILCTDGITDALTKNELEDIIRENFEDVYKCCDEITSAVRRKKIHSQDNATVVIVHYVE